MDISKKLKITTVKHILEKLKKYEKKYSEEGASVTAQENREAIDKLEGYMKSTDL